MNIYIQGYTYVFLFRTYNNKIDLPYVPWPGFPLQFFSCGPLDLEILNFVKL